MRKISNKQGAPEEAPCLLHYYLKGGLILHFLKNTDGAVG